MMNDQERREKQRLYSKRFRERHRNDPRYVESARVDKKRYNERLSNNDLPRLRRNERARISARRRYRERVDDGDPLLARHRVWSMASKKRNPLGALLTSLRFRAKRQGVPFDLTLQDMRALPMDCCPVTGEKLIPPWECNGKWNDNKATIDKVIIEKGYVRGNICWVSSKGNSLKRDNTIESIKIILAYMTSFLEKAASSESPHK